MTGIDYFATASAPPVLPAPSAPPKRQVPRRALTVAVAGLGVVAVVIGWWLRPEPIDPRPVVLPQTVAGYSTADPRLQFDTHPDVQDTMRDEFGERPWGGRAYGGVPGELLHLTVVRGDSEQRGMLTTTRPPHTTYGDVTCTETFQFTGLDGEADTGPVQLPGMLQCWRTERALSVSLLAISAEPGMMPRLAAAVDDVWALQQ